MERYRILLVDDEEKIRESVRMKIDWAGQGFSLVGAAGDGVEALELARRLRPDVVLTDVKMPRMDGLELCRRLKPLLPGAKLVLISASDEFEYARQAIRMDVFDYILKPIDALELIGVLGRLRERLDRERQEGRDIRLARRRYEESLPVLRERFYTRLLDGLIPPGQAGEEAARYGIELAPGWWTAALVRVDARGERWDESRLPSVQSFFQRSFALEGCALRTAPYRGTAALLVRMRDEGQIGPLMEELKRLCALAASQLGTALFVGVGRPCAAPELLCESMKGAVAAADCRVLAAAERVLCIGDLEAGESACLVLEEPELRALSAAVKLGSREQVAQLIRRQVDRMREVRLSLTQGQLFFLELLTALTRLARAGETDLEEIFGAEFTGTVSIAEFDSLDEVEVWLEQRALRLWDRLNRQRSDSAWKTVERAKSFIAQHYADKELSVETLCAHLHLSPAYFSTLFKRETGKSFTAYVTDLRMEQAARMLQDTDEKTYLIAERIGYADPNYFSYVFKRYFGISPSKFRAGQQLRRTATERAAEYP